jgi:hypothetical protein
MISQKFKVGDKVKFHPNWDLRNSYRIALVIDVTPKDYGLRVKYTKWLLTYVRESELTLLSPVEALLYDWEEGEK